MTQYATWRDCIGGEMPVEATWYDENHSIIVQKFIGNWTLDDYLSNIAVTQNMIASVTHTVHVITDLTDHNTPPTRIMSANRWVENTVQDNVGLTILVNPGTFLKNLIKISRPLMPRTFRDLHIVNSLDEALTLIEAYRADTDT